jgi:signal transduction histidine kinase
MTSILEANGLTVLPAADGAEALNKALSCHVDIVLVDQNMPHKTGAEVQQALHEAGFTRPVIVISGVDDLCGLSGAAKRFLKKPFDADELLGVVRQALADGAPAPALLAPPIRQRLKQAQDSLASADLGNRVKSGFLRMMAHELKTPITAMHLQMRLLEGESEVARSPRLQEGLARIARSSNRLLQLIDTCIEWARVESKRCRLATETFELVPLVGQVIAEFDSHIQKKGIQIELVAPDALPALSSDRKLARLVLLNLVSYAVQNTEKGSIKVSLDAAEGCHRVWVMDGGPPIAEKQRQEIFSPFQSDLDLRWQAGSGSGLGLYVVRDIARAIQGDVVLHGTARWGNTFLLTFPGLAQDKTHI